MVISDIINALADRIKQVDDIQQKICSCFFQLADGIWKILHLKALQNSMRGLKPIKTLFD